MTTQVQIRRGTTADHSSFTGATGEITVDTDKDVVVVHDGSTAGGFPLIKESDIGVTVQGYDADTAKTDVSQTFTAGQRAEITTLTDAATITPDFADSNNFTITLGGNRTIANPTNIVAGQSGSIFIIQDNSGNRTASWGSYWDFIGGTAPVLSTAGDSIDRIDYICRTSTSIQAVLTKAYS
jgi:hypothetical protein